MSACKSLLKKALENKQSRTQHYGYAHHWTSRCHPHMSYCLGAPRTMLPSVRNILKSKDPEEDYHMAMQQHQSNQAQFDERKLKQYGTSI